MDVLHTRVLQIMISLMIAMVSFAVALVVGMLLSKVYFTTWILKSSLSRNAHEELTKQQSEHYGKRFSSLQKKARQKISEFIQKIDEKDREIARLLSEACEKESSADSSARRLVESLRVETVTLRESVETRDERIKELNVELRKSQTQAQEYVKKLTAWKESIDPLTRKLKQQQAVIQRLGQQGPTRATKAPAASKQANEGGTTVPPEPESTKATSMI